MKNYILRSAIEAESVQIKALINLVEINPTGLDWKRFLVAVNESGQVMGCGQIKPHGGGIQELASIAVHPDHQGNGIARVVIEKLLENSHRPLYLTCISNNQGLYEKFGFRSILYAEMPRYFQRLSKLFSVAETFRHSGYQLCVMKLE